MTSEIWRTLATTNENKGREWNEILETLGGPKITILQKKLDLLEIQHIDAGAVALTKAVDAWHQDGRHLLVEDVSLAFPGTKGFPGALYRWVEDSSGLAGVLAPLQLLTDRSAIATITIAFMAENLQNICLVRVDMEGTVPMEPRGTNGFGFDSIFIPNGQNLTFAEMSSEQKNFCSMRRLAIEKLLQGEWTVHPRSESPLDRYITDI